MTQYTVAYAGNTSAATLPADAALTAGNLTPNTGVTLGVATLTQYQPNEVWTATHGTARTTLSAAVTNGGYHSVTLSRTGGLIPKAVRIKAARGGASSPRGFAIRSSADNYTADLISVADVATQRAVLTQYASADLTSLGTLTSLTFRVYHFAPTASAAVDFDDLEIDYTDTATAVVNQSDSLANVVAEVYTNRTSASADEAYDVPTSGQAATLAGAFGKLMTGDFAGAATDVNPLGYDVVLLSDTVTGRSHALLRERIPSTRYWGLYVWSRDAAKTAMVVEAPHTKADANTHTEAQSLFDKANAKAFIMATAHRNSNAALDVDGDRVSDQANADGVVNPFQEVHKVAATTGSTVVQIHGYADATEPNYDVIVSEGQSSPTQRTQSVAQTMRNSTGLRIGVYNGTVGAGLGATGNVQGIQSRAAGIYWVHVEQNNTVRTNATTRGQIEDALLTLLTPVLNKLKMGANTVGMRVGANVVSKAYLGTVQVYP